MKGTIKVVILSLALVLLCSGMASATIPYYSYTYKTWQDIYPSPHIYEPIWERFGSDMGDGIGNFNAPEDIFIDHEGNFFIADTLNNRIVKLNGDFWCVGVIDSFDNDGRRDTFNQPTGVFVTKQNEIYIADKENKRIVVLSDDLSLKMIINEPKSDIIPEDFKYNPLKVAVDNTGRIFVCAVSAIDGLFLFTPRGEFDRFFGSTPVKVNPIEKIWRMLYTSRQKEKVSLNLSMEYSNITIDHTGFIYATLRNQSREQVRRLNINGTNIIKTNKITDTRFGDYIRGGPGVPGSQVVDAAVDEDNNVYVLDIRTNKVYLYNILGDMLGVIGGKSTGAMLGAMHNPASIEVKDNILYVLDGVRGSILKFEPTDFGRMIIDANKLYIEGKYVDSMDLWYEVIKLNSNYELAYIGLGNAMYKLGNYVDAMRYFDLGFYKEGYSKAFKEHRGEIIKDNFTIFMTSIVVILAGLFVLRRFMRHKNITMRRLYGEND
ncbi:MAG: hypothetical protein FWE70_01965 [Oscillospiraceae bacterium]|nr:hypothetical protein [Oscillospiraceae bacterium]